MMSWCRSIPTAHPEPCTSFLEGRRGLSVYIPAALAEVAAAFNNRPRAALGFRTPIEALCELLARPT